MSKSRGNGVLASDLLGKARPLVVRYALASAHYRSELDLHDGFLAEAGAALGRIEAFLTRAGRESGDVVVGALPLAFETAMDDDLGVPGALAVIHDTVRAGNHAADAGDTGAVRTAASEVRAMMATLGMDPLDAPWLSRGDQTLVSDVVANILAARQAAKTESRFDVADALRDALDAAGIEIHDGPTESTWSIRG